MNIAYQLELRPTLSTVYGPLDYREMRQQLQEIDRLLLETKTEELLIRGFIEKNLQFAKKAAFLQKALRTQILLHLTNESYRDLAFRIADSELFRWFIGVSKLDGATTPSKSTIERMEHIFTHDVIAMLIHNLNKQVSDPVNAPVLLHNETPLTMNDVYADSTCVQANVHFPVDWLLFRDAVRTIMASITLIREHGIVYRMADPQNFTKEMNRLTIAMTQASCNRRGKKQRKKVFRDMKKLLKTVQLHGVRYHDLLDENWPATDWSENQTRQVLNRLKNVLDQIPAIIKIAHTRIISEKTSPNAEKILSLYEKDVHVIKRGKMDADVEFGNGLYLAEQIDGLIIDWDFYKDKLPDTLLLQQSIARIKENYPLRSYATDRGFNSKKNDKLLETESIFNATCPRVLETLVIKMKDPAFRNAQKRRAQTEGRIGIFKNKFIGKKILRKGFENRKSKILWSLLTHNLWVVARKSLEKLDQKTYLEAA